MKTLPHLALGIFTVGFMLLSSGCVVAEHGPGYNREEREEHREVRDERWCVNHPNECDHARWCSDHPNECGR